MAEAYIIDAIRTPVGRRGGGLSDVHPADLGAAPLAELFRRTDVDPAEAAWLWYGVALQAGVRRTLFGAGARGRAHRTGAALIDLLTVKEIAL